MRFMSTKPGRFGTGTNNGDECTRGRLVLSRLGSRCATMAVAAGLAVSAAIAIPAVAPADDLYYFDVWNLTAGDLTLYSYDNDFTKDPVPMPNPPNLPPLGSIIPMGKNFHVGMTPKTAVVPRFWGRGQSQNWRIQIKRSPQDSGFRPLQCAVPGPYVATSACGSYIGTKDIANVVILADEPGHTVDVAPADAQKQALVLNDLCASPYADALKVSCDYSEMKVSTASTKFVLPDKFGIHTNMSKTETTDDKYTVSQKVTTTTAYNLSFEAAKILFKLVNVAIKAEAKSVTTEEHEFTQTMGLPIPPLQTGYICVAAPLNHLVGTLRAYAGNTKWVMPNVAVDTANQSGHPLYENYHTKTNYGPIPDPCQDLHVGKLEAVLGGHN
jgi:hypothetical protein